VKLDDYLPFVLPSVKGCPDHVAIFAIRNAVIELCRRALVVDEYQAPIVAEDGLITYPYRLAPGQQAAKLLGVKVNDEPLYVYDPTKASARRDRGSDETFAMGKGREFTINPSVAAGSLIVTHCAICPSLDATTVSDDLIRFTEQIGRGAVAKLAATPERDYTNMALAGAFAARWEDDIGTARSDALRGFARSYPRTAANFF
jgi:hypothetical protein